ncbi:hypothetical protein JYU29_08370 [Tianweitania sp. BSSL-BM11]|uniref:DUF2254 domain-containing protein n=1 Tax=Tianweitania aestuarii TaxID=2814886 RepID=A0ABS5RUI2_9HYPH|nr:hypothetical protein [Tianweitania aestuarii]MBS9720698.1 hypothetical protein [Tianweitania aestuarii]
MTAASCVGIEWLGLCNYDPAAPTSNHFTLGNAVTALAFTLAVQNFLKPIYVFRLAIRHITIKRLYSMVFAGAFSCVIAALVPRMPFLHNLPIGYAIVWELLATFLFLMAYGAVAISAAVPIKVSAKRVPRFAQAAAQLISEANDSDHLELLKDLQKSLPTLIKLATFVDLKHGEERTAFFEFIHRRRLEQASYAHSLLRIIADAPFCRTLVDKAPWVVSRMLRDLGGERLYSRSAEIFVRQLAQQALLSDEGTMDRELTFHGFGTAPILSDSLFRNQFIVQKYSTLHGFIPTEKITVRVIERFNSATVRTFKTLIEHRQTDHSYSAMGAKSFYESAFMGLHAIQGADNYDFRHVMAVRRSATNAISLANKLLAATPDDAYELLYVDDLRDKHKYDILGVLVEIVFDGLQAISNKFRGPNDPFWLMAHDVMSMAFDPIRQQPDGMTPFQQRLAILIIDGLKDNMNGWYPSISRVVLSTVGPYEQNAQQPNATAYKILKDAAYLEFKKLPELAKEHPEKLGHYLPDNIDYDAMANTLAHTYFGGSIALTKLTSLNIDPVNITDKALRRRLTDDEKERAEAQLK